jgi:hypothetical protein
LLAHGQWFSPGTPASSTTKAGRRDIAESGVKHNKINQSIDRAEIPINGANPRRIGDRLV